MSDDVGVYDAMSTLRAVRRLRPDPIPDDVLRRVLDAACWAPTGGNVQPWRVIVVKDPAKKKALGEQYAKHWSEYHAFHLERIKDASDKEIEGAKKTLRAGDHLADHFGETPVVLVFCFNPKIMAITDIKLDRPTVVGGASIYPAVQNALLACRAEGLGCVLTTLLCQSEPQVKELLDIPDPWGTAAVVPIGYPVGKGHGPIARRSVEKMAFADSWGEAWS